MGVSRPLMRCSGSDDPKGGGYEIAGPVLMRPPYDSRVPDAVLWDTKCPGVQTLALPSW